ncbi:MAG TPA: hypothetical protein VM674_00390 [Candidatus Acidoferrum sp.]|nr:hypothetical protein [Candidatus Acidoferrum sp.]
MIAVGGFDGPAFVAELRQALARRPTAERFVYFGPSHITEVPPVVDEPGVIVVRGLRLTDTCKEVVDGLVRRTVPRERLVELKGPWVCSRETIQLALDRVVADSGEITNILDLSRVARLRMKVIAS